MGNASSDLDMLQVELELALKGLQLTIDKMHDELSFAGHDPEKRAYAVHSCEYVLSEVEPVMDMIVIFLWERIGTMKGIVEKMYSA